MCNGKHVEDGFRKSDADTAFVRNCELDSDYMARTVFKVLCSVPMYKSATYSAPRHVL